ncbi:MAG: nitroreductase family protein [Ruminococcus sp.]
MNKDMLNTLIERRSIRSYKKTQITDEELEAVLKAGQYAPTGRNRMSTQFVAIQNKELIARLSEWNAAVMGTDSDPFYGAPTVILVLADSNINTYREDGALALGNMMNAAYAAGLGSCWINRAREMFSSSEGKELLREWGLSESLEGIGFCILGYPDCIAPSPVPRREDQILIIK